MKFSHPLARGAKVWSAKPVKGRAERILVIVTTMALDPKSKRYKKPLVARLSDAALDYLAAHPKEANGFMLINRLRDWREKSRTG
jgi:hypothetical protein